MRTFKNFIFDWSGTLVDDLGPVLDSTNKVFNHFGKPSFTREKFCSEFSLPFKNFYERFLPDISMPELELLYTKFFNESEEKVKLLEGSRDLLDVFKKSKVNTYLLSSIQKQHFENQAAELGLLNMFNHVYTEALDKRDWISKLLKDNFLKKEETVFIGDMQHDIETAQFAGVYSVAVLTGYNSREMLEKSSPDLIVNNLMEFKELIFSNN